MAHQECNADLEDEYDDEDSDSDEDPLILQLLESMFQRKKTVQESLEMQKEIDLRQLRQEFRAAFLAEKVRLADGKRNRKLEKRMYVCDRLS